MMGQGSGYGVASSGNVSTPRIMLSWGSQGATAYPRWLFPFAATTTGSATSATVAGGLTTPGGIAGTLSNFVVVHGNPNSASIMTYTLEINGVGSFSLVAASSTPVTPIAGSLVVPANALLTMQESGSAVPAFALRPVIQCDWSP